MAEVNLTQEIANDFDQKGYIDQVVSEIKAIKDREDLVMNITCVGGDVFQGDRLHRAIIEHPGHTKAIVIGLAASMAGVLLAAFDEVELDSDCDVMLHKAHIPFLPVEEYTQEQIKMCETFNNRAFNRLKKNGIDEKVLNEIFLSDETEDFWFTAKEAEALGLGSVVTIERRNSQPFKVAAKLDLNKIKNQYKEMGIFDKKKKAVARVVTLADKRVVAFSSEVEDIEVGDTLTLIGSNDSLEGKIRLSDTQEAEVNSSNEVVDIKDVEAPKAAEHDPEEDKKRIKELEDKIADLEAQFGDEEEEEEKKEEAKAEAKAVAEANAKDSNAVLDALAAAKAVLAEVKTSGRLLGNDNKHEKVLSNLSENDQHVRDLMSVRNELKKPKIKE